MPTSSRAERRHDLPTPIFISRRTVESHVARLLAKLGVSTRTAVAGAAIAAGLVDTGTKTGTGEIP